MTRPSRFEAVGREPNMDGSYIAYMPSHTRVPTNNDDNDDESLRFVNIIPRTILHIHLQPDKFFLYIINRLTFSTYEWRM